MSTPCFCFARFSCCGFPGFDHLKINFAGLRQRLVSLPFKKTIQYTSICLSIFFFMRSMFALSLALLTLFVIQAVLDTIHVTVFGQSNVVSAGAMGETFFFAS